MERNIIRIDEDLCDGCAKCVPNCHEGALQIIDGKARVISELMCDGLGACIGHCPQGAITIEKREVVPYDETAVITEISKKGRNNVIAHLLHLKEHHQKDYLIQALEYLKSKKEVFDFSVDEVISQVHNAGMHSSTGCGCPGAQVMSFASKTGEKTEQPAADSPSELRQWPVQMHLINPAAPYFIHADLLLAADCVAFAMGNFHSMHLKNKRLVIACPKLDNAIEQYIEKIRLLIDEAKVNTITVMMMEVPCCSGLLDIVRSATSQAIRKVPVKSIIVSIREGKVLKEEWD